MNESNKERQHNVPLWLQALLPLRLYASICLRVPVSGLSWLDEMIREARLLDTMTDRSALKHAMENLQQRMGRTANGEARTGEGEDLSLPLN